MNKTKNNSIRNIFIMTSLIIIVIIVYYFSRNRTSFLFLKSNQSVTEAQKLINEDISNNYPSTPRAVLKLYCRLTKVFHSDKLEEKQINRLAEQLQLLLDEELIAVNPSDDYLINLNIDISDYRKENHIIMQYKIGESDTVSYWKKANMEYASLKASFTLKEGKEYSKLYENFIFRKDKNGNWKILGWKLTDMQNLDSE